MYDGLISVSSDTCSTFVAQLNVEFSPFVGDLNGGGGQ